MSKEVGGSPTAPPPRPRWVKVSLLIGAALLIALLILHAAGGGIGNHG